MRVKDTGQILQESRTKKELVRDAWKAAKAAREEGEEHRDKGRRRSWLSFSIALVVLAAILLFLKLHPSSGLKIIHGLRQGLNEAGVTLFADHVVDQLRRQWDRGR